MNPEPFNTLDREFGALVAALDNAPPEIAGIAAAAMYAVRTGHSALPLPDRETGARLLGFSRIAAADPARRTPLVVTGGLIYLHKFYQYETAVVNGIRNRRDPLVPAVEPDWENVHDYFSNGGSPEQRAAVQLALNRRFAVITGGPGTGKTTVAAALLALEIARNRGIRIALAAPTGKAAARLAEAIGDEVPRLRLPLPAEWATQFAPQTLHRLLGMRGSGLPPRHDAQNPLRYDLVVLDESSMVSLPLMARLFAALRPDCRLLLLGDADQLNAIECGSVLGDIVRAGGDRVPVARLFTNHRARANPRLIDFATRMTVPEPDAQALAAEITETDFPEFGYSPLPAPGQLRRVLAEQFETWGMTRPATPEDAFRLTDSCKILCAVRQGPYGVEALNEIAASLLQLPPGVDGAPLMVLENHPSTGLSNGDVGIWWGGRAHFRGIERAFHPAELPRNEPALAMTIHKSQGSGFDRVLMLTGPADIPLYTRELFYTGMTRTRRVFRIWSTPEVLHSMLGRKTERYSGLTARAGDTQG